MELIEIKLFICIKMKLALNNLQRLIYHKKQTNKRDYANQNKYFLNFSF